MNIRPFDRSKSPLPTPAYSPWKPYRALVLVVVFHLIGTTWGKNFDLLDLPLCCALCLSLLGGWEIGSVAGAIAGVLLMWTQWQYPGAHLFSRLLPPLLVGLLAVKLPPLHPFVPPFVGALGAVLAQSVFILVSPRAMTLPVWIDHTIHFALVQALWMWPVMLCVARVAKTRNRLLFG